MLALSRWAVATLTKCVFNATISSTADPSGILSKLSVMDYFVDSQTSLIVKSSDTTHPADTVSRSYPNDLELQGYVEGTTLIHMVKKDSPFRVTGSIISSSWFDLRLVGSGPPWW